MNLIRRLAKRSKAMVIAYHIYDNWRATRRVSGGQRPTSHSGSTHRGISLSESLAYIDRVFDDYLRYSGLCAEYLCGQRVLEVGPGDNLGVAMKFMCAGARQVVCLDKFLTEHDSAQQRRIYQALRASMTRKEKKVYDTVVNLDRGVEINADRLKYLSCVAIEEAAETLGDEPFDLIVSRAVLEHVYDPDMALIAMDRLLAPGGLMLHDIDFRDHGLFTDGGQHP